MGKVILWPDRPEALHRADGDTDGYDLTGATIIDVPADFNWLGRCVDWATLTIADELTPIRSRLRDAVCAKAEDVRSRFITTGSGQAITYTRKEAEARAWAAGNDPATAPFLAAEAAATDTTIDALAALVVQLADAWVAAGSAIEARRRALLVAIEAAATREALDAIDIAAGWPEAADA